MKTADANENRRLIIFKKELKCLMSKFIPANASKLRMKVKMIHSVLSQFQFNGKDFQKELKCLTSKLQ